MKDNAFQRLIDPLKRKIALTLARAIVKVVNDDANIQRMQIGILKDELRDSVERFQDYGITSKPHSDAEAVVAFIGGDRSHAIILKVDDRRYRMKGLQNGEVAMYSDEGDFIHFKRNKEISISTNKFVVTAATEINLTAPTMNITASTSINIECPQSTHAGNLSIQGGLTMVGSGGGAGEIIASGNITDHAGSMDEMRTTYNSHTHNETNSVTNQPNQTMT